MAPLARLQYTLEQYRNGTVVIPEDRPSIILTTSPSAIDEKSSDKSTLNGTLDAYDANGVSEGAHCSSDMIAASAGFEEEDGVTGIPTIGEEGWNVEEDQTRLLPPVVVPQVNNTYMVHVIFHLFTVS